MATAKIKADDLGQVSRDFYENTKFKMLLSFVFAAASLTFLGFSTESGGESASIDQTYELDNPSDDKYVKFYEAQVSGYGFASFCHFSAFVIALAAAIIISPVLSGSPTEKKSVTSPQELVLESQEPTVANRISAQSESLNPMSPAK